MKEAVNNRIILFRTVNSAVSSEPLQRRRHIDGWR